MVSTTSRTRNSGVTWSSPVLADDEAVLGRRVRHREHPPRELQHRVVRGVGLRLVLSAADEHLKAV